MQMKYCGHFMSTNLNYIKEVLFSVIRTVVSENFNLLWVDESLNSFIQAFKIHILRNIMLLHTLF